MSRGEWGRAWRRPVSVCRPRRSSRVASLGRRCRALRLRSDARGEIVGGEKEEIKMLAMLIFLLLTMFG